MGGNGVRKKGFKLDVMIGQYEGTVAYDEVHWNDYKVGRSSFIHSKNDSTNREWVNVEDFKTW